MNSQPNMCLLNELRQAFFSWYEIHLNKNLKVWISSNFLSYNEYIFYGFARKHIFGLFLDPCSLILVILTNWRWTHHKENVLDKEIGKTFLVYCEKIIGRINWRALLENLLKIRCESTLTWKALSNRLYC